MLKYYLHKILFILKKYHKVLIATVVLVILLTVASLWDYYNTQQLFNDSGYYKVKNIRVPKVLFFANEKVPVDKYKVRKAIANEIAKNTHWQQKSASLHRLTHKWFPVIEPVLKKYNVPDDFKYIVIVESHFSNITSPKGAAGFWQIIESTGKHYGLKINDTIDERLNVVKSTEVACKYFVEAHEELRDWILVAASYNKGIGGIQKQLKKQKTNNFFKLRLSKETGTYVYKIIAIKELVTHPKVYGLKVPVQYKRRE